MTRSNADPGVSARRLLVECEGTPFAPSENTRPVVAVLDGRKTNDELTGDAWLDAIEATRGAVAIYFELPADHEWWIAYDHTAAEGERWHRWARYPTGAWDHSTPSRGILAVSIDDIEGHTHDLYRSRVVPVWDAREFVVEEVTPPAVTDRAGRGVMVADADADADAARGSTL